MCSYVTKHAVLGWHLHVGPVLSTFPYNLHFNIPSFPTSHYPSPGWRPWVLNVSGSPCACWLPCGRRQVPNPRAGGRTSAPRRGCPACTKPWQGEKTRSGERRERRQSVDSAIPLDRIGFFVPCVLLARRDVSLGTERSIPSFRMQSFSFFPLESFPPKFVRVSA